jgi:hypothetical protein
MISSYTTAVLDTSLAATYYCFAGLKGVDFQAFLFCHHNSKERLLATPIHSSSRALQAYPLDTSQCMEV